MSSDVISKDRADASPTLQKWGALACLLIVVSFVVAPLIYLMGNLRDPLGPLGYDLADFLHGPVWAASLVTMISVLRERLDERAPRRMSLAFLTAILAAATLVMVACIRSANRHYHIAHPDLHLENSIPVLTAWTTMLAGLTAAGWHFLGWTLILVSWAGWTARAMPRALSVFYLLAGISGLFAYLGPALDSYWRIDGSSPFAPLMLYIRGNGLLFGTIAILWQGIIFSREQPA